MYPSEVLLSAHQSSIVPPVSSIVRMTRFWSIVSLLAAKWIPGPSFRDSFGESDECPEEHDFELFLVIFLVNVI